MIVMVFAVLLTCGAWAQGQRREFNSADMAQRRTENLEKQLDLDSIQSKKVYALYLAQADSMKVRMEKMFQGGQQGGQRMEMTDEQRAAMKAEQDTFNTKMKAILTEEQYVKYEKLPRGGFGGRRGGGQQGGGQQN